MSQIKQPRTIYLKNYQPTPFQIDSVHLHFDLHEDHVMVKAILEFKRREGVDLKAGLVLDGQELELKKIAINGELLSQDRYKTDADHLVIDTVPNQFTLETEVLIKPQENTQLSGLYQSRNNFCTQCEAEGFRRITYFYDRPDVMTRFTTTIAAEKSKYPYLLSNGNLIEEKDLADGRHWVHWEDPSLKPCYLFALIAGDFDLLEDQFTTMSGRKVDLRLFVEKGFLDQTDYAMQSLKRAMKWDEETYGREYDLDIYMIVAVSDFNMGAMENKGLNVFNTKYVLAKTETATDADYVAIEDVIGHEYFHNWSGNRVTCRDWFQITLKEGLTVFRDQSFSVDMTSNVTRLDEINIMRNRQFAEDAGPMAHPIRTDSYIEINNFYTVTVYNKGAEVIRMVQTLLGKETFRTAMDEYFSRFDGQAVTTEDFIQVMEDISGRDLTQFKYWYSQAGTPVLDIQSEYNQAEKTFVLTVKQSCPATPGQDHKKPFHFPLAMGLVGPECKDMDIKLENETAVVSGTRILEIKKPEQTFTFVDVDQKPVPSLLRGFSAPVLVNYNYTNEELAWLLQCDHDAFGRWEAAQMLGFNVLSDLIHQQKDQKALQKNDLLTQSFDKLLNDGPEDLSFLARLMVLPTEGFVLQRLPKTDIDYIHAARQFIKKNLAKDLEAQFLKHYKNLQSNAYQYNQKEMGRRSLKNLSLAYLLETKKPEYFAMAYEQFQKADNMTDMMGALNALNNHDCKEREQALDEFYHRFQHEALVVNKWLSLQASSHLPNTLSKVQSLLKHSAFDINNPNNVYALVGGFSANMILFHNKSGNGYDFLMNQVLEIDSKNAIVAARMLQPLTQWKILDDMRGKLMRIKLQQLSGFKHLSKDVFEVVEKSI